MTAPASQLHFLKLEDIPMAKSKSMQGSDGGRKLAAGHGRTKQKSAGEPQKDRPVPRGSGRRTGSAKKAK
jgi:hypothetical protein